MTSGEDEIEPTPPLNPLYHVPHPPKVTWYEPEPVKPGGSEWTPLLLLALGIFVLVAIIATVVLLNSDVQFH